MKNKKPNIVFLFPDQFRSDFIESNGADWLETPNINSIAKNGINYKNAFSASPVCVPARTCLLTGMNAIKNGVASNLHNLRADWKEAGVKIFPEIFSDSGYYTAGIGKMHFYPWDEKRGFQYRVVCEDKRWLDVRDDYYHYLKDHGLKKPHGNEMDGYHENKGAVINTIPWEHSWDRFVGSESVKFIENYSIPNSDTAYLIPASTKKISNKIYEMTNSLRNVVVEPFVINEFLSISEFSIVTSGTASLESAVIGCPPIICYKTNPLNYFIISRMLKVQNIGLPNLLLGDSVFPELVQNECNQKNLLLAADKIFKITPQMKKIQSEIKEKLCGVGFANAAKSILDL